MLYPFIFLLPLSLLTSCPCQLLLSSSSSSHTVLTDNPFAQTVNLIRAMRYLIVQCEHALNCRNQPRYDILVCSIYESLLDHGLVHCWMHPYHESYHSFKLLQRHHHHSKDVRLCHKPQVSKGTSQSSASLRTAPHRCA